MAQSFLQPNPRYVLILAVSTVLFIYTCMLTDFQGMGEVIQLQGDQRSKIRKFLMFLPIHAIIHTTMGQPMRMAQWLLFLASAVEQRH